MLNKLWTKKYTKLIKFVRRLSSTQIEYTNRRHKVKRGEYEILNYRHLDFFRKFLGPTSVVTDPNDLDTWNTDWLRAFRGQSQLLLKPRSTAEVSRILKYCNEERLSICPQGGNTSFVGGSVPVFDEIILSTSLMNKIISVDTTSGALTCEAGCILENLNEYLGNQGFVMPLDLGSKGSCQIGGNVATNAGGMRLFRYGSLHSNILGLEVVLANGTILDNLSEIKKDNTGYDLKHLFIGSEGTLGIITKVSIQCPVKSKSSQLIFLALDSFENVLAVNRKAKLELSEILSCFEYMDSTSMMAVTTNLNLNNPLPVAPFYMFIECAGSNKNHDEEKVNDFLQNLMDNGICNKGTLCSTPAQKTKIWALRERVAEAYVKDGRGYFYDLSLPVSQFENLVRDVREHLGSSVSRCGAAGHLGDGNIHIAFTTSLDDDQFIRNTEKYIYEWIQKVRGSISAEHGLGFQKRKNIFYSKTPETVEIMKLIKNSLDPNGILNPYKVLIN